MTVRQRCDAALSAAVASCSDLRTHLTPSRGDLVGACLCALAALFIIVYAACGFSDAPWFVVRGRRRAARRLRRGLPRTREAHGNRSAPMGARPAGGRAACHPGWVLPARAPLEQPAAAHGAVLRAGEPVRARRAVRHRVRGRTAHARSRHGLPAGLPRGGRGQPLRHPVQGAARRAGRPVRPVYGGLGGRGLHVFARRAAPRDHRRVRRRLHRRRLRAEGGGHAAAPRGEQRVRAGAGRLFRLVDRVVRHGEGLRRHRGRLGREGVVRRAGIDAVLPQARAGSEPRPARRLRRRRRCGAARRARRRRRRNGGRDRGAHRHRHHERDVLRPLALPRPGRHRRAPRVLLRHPPPRRSSRATRPSSALGGGTCNSEFEFLTGSSMGHLGGGVYPYVLYDLDGTESLVSYFDALGYATHAIHPAESTNWRRDRVYDQLGFDAFTRPRAPSPKPTRCAASPPTARRTTTCSTCWPPTRTRSSCSTSRCRTTAATTWAASTTT